MWRRRGRRRRNEGGEEEEWNISITKHVHNTLPNRSEKGK